MRITVREITQNGEATLSAVYVDGEFVCFGLEDIDRGGFKIPDHTRIPRGVYKMGVRTEGGFSQRYATKFPTFHQGCLQVLDVPNFEYILIHIGNTIHDTSGCLLVGGIGNASEEGRLTISGSVVAYRKLYNRVIQAAKNGVLDIEYC